MERVTADQLKQQNSRKPAHRRACATASSPACCSSQWIFYTDGTPFS